MKYLLLMLITVSSFAQVLNTNMQIGIVPSTGGTAVVTLDTSSYPLTPFGNGWVTFNGVGNKQFMRSRDLNFVEAIYSVTDSFRLFVRLKIKTRKAMWITGKHNGSAGSWVLGFNTNTGNMLEFYLNGWKNIKALASTDTNWYNIAIVFRKSDNVIRGYYNDTLGFETTSFSYTSSNNANAFSVGHGQMPANIADPTTGNGNPASYFASCTIDSLAWHKYLNGGDSAIVYGFNEGAGQYAYDSLTYLEVDRTSPDGSYLANHLQSGWNSAPDSQDVTFSPGTRKNTTAVTNLGTGLWKWEGTAGVVSFVESYTNGLTIWQNKIVPSANFSRVNVTQGTWTHNGDTATWIAQWNGTTWSKIGSNGSLFTNNIVQAYDWQDTLIAGGSFINVGDANGDYIKRFDGTDWTSMGSGFDADVYCMGTNTNGKLIVGGGFNNSGATPITSGVAQWDYGTWSAVGTNDIASVWALVVNNGVLYAGATNGLYYLNGSTWTLVSGTTATVFTAVVYKGDIWAGNTSGAIYKWDGSTLSTMGTASGFTTHIIDMQVYGNDLYVAGSFYRIIYNGVNTVCNKLARWNGQRWSAINSPVTANTQSYGVDQRPEDLAIATFNGIDYLVVTGDHYWFDGVGSNNIALIRLN